MSQSSPEPALAHERLADSPAVGPAAESSGCPTPMEWQEVLGEFLNTGEHWSFPCEQGEVLGRTIGTGPPLYFLNGITGTHELYCLTVWLLRDQFRCVLLDYPDSANVTIESLADVVARVADQHGDRNIAWYANGFGSLVAWSLALRYPQLVSRIVAQGALSAITPSLSESFLAGIGRMWPGRFARVPGRWALQQRSHRPWFPPYDPTRFEFYLQSSGKNRTSAVAGRFRAAGKVSFGKQLESVQQSVLLIRSEGEGPVQMQSHDELSRRLPHTRTEFLHTCGQIPFLTHPHRLAKLLSEFLLEPEVPGRSA